MAQLLKSKNAYNLKNKKVLLAIFKSTVVMISRKWKNVKKKKEKKKNDLKKLNR